MERKMNALMQQAKIYMGGVILIFSTLQLNAINLKLKITDSETGKTIPARVLIKNSAISPDPSIRTC
jgi:hypothetical protein